MSDDELTPYANDPVVAALRAPASPDELAGQEAALAMFRRASAGRRRGLRRAAIGGVGVAVGLTLTGGVAAAYTTGLPGPVQDVVSSVIATVGVPAPPHAPTRVASHPSRHVLPPKVTVGAPTPTPAPRQLPAGSPPQARPMPTPAPASAAPIARPSAQPSASPTPAPPPSLSAAVSRRVVPVHSTVLLSGRLTRGGQPLAGRRVYAAELPAGSSTWRRVANARTGSDGSVSLTVPALTTNVRLRLVTEQGTRSSQLAVSVVPKLSLSVARSGNQRVATATADGGRPGDTLVLLRRDGDDHWTNLGTTRLDSSRTGSFTVPGPRATQVRYRVRLSATAIHAASFAEFVVRAR